MHTRGNACADSRPSGAHGDRDRRTVIGGAHDRSRKHASRCPHPRRALTGPDVDRDRDTGAEPAPCGADSFRAEPAPASRAGRRTGLHRDERTVAFGDRADGIDAGPEPFGVGHGGGIGDSDGETDSSGEPDSDGRREPGANAHRDAVTDPHPPGRVRAAGAAATPADVRLLTVP